MSWLAAPRSLFARLFVAFAVVTVGTTLGVSAYWDASLARRHEQRAELNGDALRLHGDAIAARFREGDAAGVHAELARLFAVSDLRVELVTGGRVLEAVPGAEALPASDAFHTLDAAPGEVAIEALSSEAAWYAYRPAGAPELLLRASFEDLHAPLRSVRLVMLVLVTGLVAFAFARHLSRPIRTLRAATRRIAEGDTTVRVGLIAGAGEELGAFAADFDRMTARIEELLRARERLLRDVSHELRSPLARLQVALGIARQRAPEELGPLLDRMERETDRLGELIGLVLSMARLEESRGVVNPTEVRVDELLEALVRDARFEAEGSGRDVTLTASAPAPVEGDPELLRQALENVLRNALRFTPAGTSVEVAVRVEERNAKPEEGRVVVTVRDHGPGVPASALEEIFRPFTRVEVDRDRASGGAGVGLAITERAVRLHRGRVVAANAEGGGLLVTFELPSPTRA